MRELPVRVDGRLGLFLDGRGLLLASGFHASFVVQGQDFRAAQIFVGVDVFLFLLLLLASPLLARGFGYILGGLGAAFGCTGEKLGRGGATSGTEITGAAKTGSSNGRWNGPGVCAASLALR